MSEVTISPINFPDIENRAHYLTILNSKTRPATFGKVDFDVHVIYSTLEEREEAVALREFMKIAFQDKHLYVGELIDVPVGPWRAPMWEANFQIELLSDVILWLMDNRGNLKVVVHKLIGDSLWDHTMGAIFFGDAAPFLDVSFFTKS